MNRRSFFNSLSSAVAGIYIACHVNLGKLDALVPEASRPVYVGINPSWVGAPHELVFTWPDNKYGLLSPAIVPRSSIAALGYKSTQDPPLRYDDSKTLVPKYILV